MTEILREFIDRNLGEMCIAKIGEEPWVCKKHPDGQYVTVRKATQDDLRILDYPQEMLIPKGLFGR